MLAVVAASRDFFQVQRGFLSSPIASERIGYEAAPLSGVDLQTAYVGWEADFVSAAPREVSPSLHPPSGDYASTAYIVAMVAIFGYTFQRMSARKPRHPATEDDEAAMRLAGSHPGLHVAPARAAMLTVAGKTVAGKAVAGKAVAGKVQVQLEPTTTLKAKLLAECGEEAFGGRPNRAAVAELILQLEALNKTKSPALSELLNGRWKFLYATGASPALEALKVMIKGVEAIPTLPFGPAPVRVEDTFLTISAKRYASASTKVRVLSHETTLNLQSKLEADTPVRLIETYQSTGSEPLGLFPVQLPALPYKRPLLVSYLDETMLIVRDEAGRPDVLTRAALVEPPTDVHFDDSDDAGPKEMIGEAVAGLETKVKELAEDVVHKAHKAERKTPADPVLAAFDKVAAAGMTAADQAAFFEQQAEFMTERADFFMEQQDDLDKRVAEFEFSGTWKEFGVAEARAFCQEKAEEFQKKADALTKLLASAVKEIEDTKQCEFVDELEQATGLLLDQQVDELQRQADAVTERVAFFLQEIEAMKARVALCDEAATQDALEFLYERKRFLQTEADAMTERAALFQREADACRAADFDEEDDKHAEAGRTAFFDGTVETKKKRGPFSFLRRKKGKDAVKAVEVEVEKAVAEVKTEALEIDHAVENRLREEEEQARELASRTGSVMASVNDELSKNGLYHAGFSGFLGRKKAGTTTARKPKKGRALAKTHKRRWFGFMRRKTAAAEGDEKGTA
jgi:hypothetical protein